MATVGDEADEGGRGDGGNLRVQEPGAYTPAPGPRPRWCRVMAAAAQPGRAATQSSISEQTAWMTVMCISWMRAVSLLGTTSDRCATALRPPPVPPVSAHRRLSRAAAASAPRITLSALPEVEIATTRSSGPHNAVAWRANTSAYE